MLGFSSIDRPISWLLHATFLKYVKNNKMYQKLIFIFFYNRLNGLKDRLEFHVESSQIFEL